MAQKGEHLKEKTKEILRSLYTPEKRQEMSELMKEVWKDPEYANKISESLKDTYVKHPEKRKQRSKLLKQYHIDHPEYAIEIGKRSKEKWQDIEFREKAIKGIKLAIKEGRLVPGFETTTETQEDHWLKKCDKSEREIIKRKKVKGDAIEYKLCTNEEVFVIYKLAQPFRNYLIINYPYAPKNKMVVEDKIVPKDILTYDQIAEMFNTTRGNVHHYANMLSRKKLFKSKGLLK